VAENNGNHKMNSNQAIARAFPILPKYFLLIKIASAVPEHTIFSHFRHQPYLRVFTRKIGRRVYYLKNNHLAKKKENLIAN
jgi:hypothetical protein